MENNIIIGEEDYSQSSGLDTDIFSDSDSDLDAHLQEKGEFFGCYLLVSRNPKFKGRTYIGFTVDPNRRIKQHNRGCHKGGARKTSGKGPWEMVLIVHGFPNHIAALRFEWAWQHPDRSRRLQGKNVSRKSRKETAFEYRFRILAEMLSVGPWWRLPLTIRWLKQEHQIQFPPDKQPPVHMPIAYGLIDFCKVPQKDRFHALAQEEEGRDEEEGTSSASQHASAVARGDGDVARGDGDVARGDGGGESALHLEESCLLCNSQDKNLHGGELLRCYHRHCTLSAHVTCLAPRLIEKDERNLGLSHLLPVAGPCPKCGQELLWGELVRASKYRANEKNSDGRVKSKRKRKAVLSSSQPTRKRKVKDDDLAGVRSHWSEALHVQ